MTLRKLGDGDTATLHSRVYRQLSVSIIEGQFEPGQQLTLLSVADLLGTSVMPVREAIRRLVSEQALEMPSTRRIRIPLASVKRLEDLFRARKLIEGEAAGMAAASLSQRDYALLAASSELVDEALTAGNRSAAVAHNRTFWTQLFQASDSHIFSRLTLILWLQFGPYLALVLRHGSAADLAAVLGTSIRPQLLRRVQEGDSDGARAALSVGLSEAAAAFKSLHLLHL